MRSLRGGIGDTDADFTSEDISLYHAFAVVIGYLGTCLDPRPSLLDDVGLDGGLAVDAQFTVSFSALEAAANQIGAVGPGDPHAAVADSFCIAGAHEFGGAHFPNGRFGCAT